MQTVFYEKIMQTVFCKVSLPESEIEKICDEISTNINDALRKENLIVEDVNIARCDSKGEGYFSIDPHAIFRIEYLVKTLKEMCEKHNFQMKQAALYAVAPVHIKRQLPYFNKASGWQAGGTNNDEFGIDENIDPLVKVLNAYEGVETFSSCEGHFSTSPYILWFHRDNNMDNLHKVLLDITDAANDTTTEMDLEHDIQLDLGCMPDLWTTKNPNDPVRQERGISRSNEFYSGPVFRIMLKLNWGNFRDQNLPYKYIKLLSEKLKTYQEVK